MSNNQWSAAIGLEIHAQLSTKSKLFSPDSVEFTNKGNVHIHPVSLGLPGTLPVLNSRVLEYAVRTGLALNSHINKRSVFARKNYFYPDLPKGYQISQYDKPICERGEVEFSSEGISSKVRIRRVHIEEDAGRLHHLGHYSLVDFNRAGVPLVEIVSEPDMQDPRQAAELARTIRQILRYLQVCDGNLEQGSLRCDCNVSVKKKSDSKLGSRVELKNLNSFKFIEKALDYEIKRHISILTQGGRIAQETRLYDSAKNKTASMRSKESASDYRYFPDPDLLPVVLEEKWIEEQKKQIPELPKAKAHRFCRQYQLSPHEVHLLTEEKALADYFEQVAKRSRQAQASANWIINEILANLNESKKTIVSCPVSPEQLGVLIQKIDSNILSGKLAKKVLAEMWETGEDCESIIQKRNLKPISDDRELALFVQQVLQKFPSQAADYKKGKTKIFGFFVGEVMKITRGQADPKKLNIILKQKLSE